MIDDYYTEFPAVGEAEASQDAVQEQSQNQERPTRKRGFNNPLYPNDSVTTCNGFINDIRTHEKEGRTMYFMRVGMITGSKLKEDSSGYIGDITNCDLLVGDTLKKWVQGLLRSNDSYDGVIMRFTIRNLKFTPDIYEGKPVLKSRGVLEAVSIGHLG